MALNLTVKEIMSKYGVSRTTARRYRQQGVPEDKKVLPEYQQPVNIDREAFLKPENGTVGAGATFSVEQAPDNIFPEEKPIDKVLKKLGVEKTPAPKSASLNKNQQGLFDTFAPMAVQAFIFVTGWSWSNLAGPDYKILAPDKEVAQKIIHPLARVYARHSKIAGALDPDAIDISASITALIGYAWASMSMYQIVKQDIERGAYENEQEITSVSQNGHTNGHQPGDSTASERENAPSKRHTRRYATRSDSSINGTNSSSNGGTNNFNIGNLTSDERYQYEALSKLRSLDTITRARRSGRG